MIYRADGPPAECCSCGEIGYGFETECGEVFCADCAATVAGMSEAS